MIPEPVHSGEQATQRRNNNLLCVAIVLFFIGLGVVEIFVMPMPFWIAYFGFDPTLLLIIAIFFGVLPTLGGIYVMWRWWESSI